jgi:HK97 family phage portal protein
MNIFERLFKPHITKEPAVPYLYNYQAVPPSRDTSGFLSAYGEVGWLYAVVSKIAQGVADAKWSVYAEKNGEETEVEKSPIMDVLNFVNPFQTFQEFIELHEIYMGLAGESFWVVNKNKGGLPGELWMVPPDRMSVVPSKKDFIAGYIYKVGSETIPLDKENVIHFKLPNPMNPYRGLGFVQAMAQDLDGEINAAKWNNKFFYNSARPDVVMFPDGDVSEENFQRLKEQFKERHQGTANSNRMAIASGIKDIKLLSISAKDMDFKELRLLNRDNILGIFGMPQSVMGISENVNRANAEAGDYTFARWIVQPRLNRIKNKLNEQFLPMFPYSENLCLDFDDVVPESVEENRMLAESGIKSGYMTINEARQIQGLEPVDESVGDVFMTSLGAYPVPINSETPQPSTQPEQPIEQPVDANPDTVGGIVASNTLNGIQIQSALHVLRDLMANNIPDTVALELLVAVGIDRERAQEMINSCSSFTPENPGYDPTKPTAPPGPTLPDVPQEPAKSVKKKRELSTEWKETYWRGYVTRSEAYEKKMITALQGMFSQQEEEALGKLNAGSRELIDISEAKVAYSKIATPILMDLYKLTIQNGRELIKPKPHKDAPEDAPVSPGALAWLKARILWAAEGITVRTAKLLNNIIEDGYREGWDIPTMARFIRDNVFGDSAALARSTMIARTETLSASAQGAIEGYKEADIQQAEVLASFDERTCDDCDSLSGEVFNLDDCVGVLPVHTDCRCCWIPVV